MGASIHHPELLFLEAEAADQLSQRDLRRNARRRKRARPTNYVKREDRVRSILETLTPYEWPSIRPNWLKNPETNRNMELDCYCLELAAAFEVDGLQHHRRIRHFHRGDSFEAQRRRDTLKEALCRQRQIKLVRVPPREHVGASKLVLWVMEALSTEVGYSAGEIK